MLSQAQIKHIRALQQRKFRMLHGSFVVEGEKVVAELLQSSFEIAGVYALDQWMDTHRHLIPGTCQAHVISAKELSRISGLTTPNKVLAVVKMPDPIQHKSLADRSFTLYLDCIQDPGNLGTIIRSADWFGIGQIYCSAGTAEVYNPKVIQASMGSFLRVGVTQLDFAQLLNSYKTKPVVYGAALHGRSLFESGQDRPGIVIIGNESRGISDNLAAFVDTWIRIHGSGNRAESLNASVAASIMMAWYTRN
jgi:RNA methyltransferase, TrmH family